MGFSDPSMLPPRTPQFRGIPTDEHAVRRGLQRGYRRPRREPWRDTWRRVLARHRKRVREWQKEGVITDQTAGRMLQCDSPNTKKPSTLRRYCEHPSCPSCLYRKRLATVRTVWRELCAPELERRRSLPPGKRGTTKLALGTVDVAVLGGVDVVERVGRRLRELNAEQVSRKIAQAGGISHGLATTSIHRRTDGSYNIRVCVLGLTDRNVHLRQPQARHRRDADGMVNTTEAWAIEWSAAVRGQACPKFGPDSTLRLVAAALPVANDDTGLRTLRYRPLGRCRCSLHFRPHPFPKPIRYKSSVGHFDPQRLRDHLDESVERLERHAGRRLLRRLGQTVGAVNHNFVIGRFFREQFEFWQATYKRDHVDLPDVCRRLRTPVRLVPYEYYHHNLPEYLPPPKDGGPLWDAVLARLMLCRTVETIFAQHPSFALCRWPVQRQLDSGEDRIEVLSEAQIEVLHEAPSMTEGDPDACFVIRPPGKSRGAAVIHNVVDALQFGNAERIRRSRFYVQPLGRFLDWMLAGWPEDDRIRDFSDLLSRATL